MELPSQSLCFLPLLLLAEHVDICAATLPTHPTLFIASTMASATTAAKAATSFLPQTSLLTTGMAKHVAASEGVSTSGNISSTAGTSSGMNSAIVASHWAAQQLVRKLASSNNTNEMTNSSTTSSTNTNTTATTTRVPSREMKGNDLVVMAAVQQNGRSLVYASTTTSATEQTISLPDLVLSCLLAMLHRIWSDLHLSIALGAAGGVTGCCCGWCAACMIGIIRKRKTGTVRLADCPEFRARYSVERAKSSKSSGDQTSTSKTRIVWNFDEDKLKKLFGGKVPSVSDGEEAVMPTDIEASMVASSWSSKIDGSKSLGSSKWGYDLSEKPRTSTGEELGLSGGSQTAYLDGAWVEYLSKTHCRWVKGQVSLQVVRSEEGRYRLCYNVKLDKVSRARLDVALDMLRSPLEVDDDVVVFLRRQDGIWAPGKIVSSQRGKASSFSYKVQLGDGHILSQVPPERLRRMFAPGSSVEVWRGIHHGWVLASVQDAMQVKFPHPLSPWSPVPPSEEALMTPRSTASKSSTSSLRPSTSKQQSLSQPSPRVAFKRWSPRSPRCSPGSPRSMWMQSRDISKALHPWIMVPVIEEDSLKAHDAVIEEVPLYLIPRPELSEDERLSFPFKRRGRI